jgi:hypothetical protein
LEPWIGFVFASLASFAAMSLLDLWHTYTTMTAATMQDLIWHVATYQAPLRDLQIHGLALLMILGVSLRMMPVLLGVPATPPKRAWRALGMLIGAVAGEVGIFIAYRWSGHHAVAALLMLPWMALAAGCAMIVLPWKLWRPTPGADRSVKFIKTSYLWLGVSLTMLLLLPAYQAVVKVPFSHAYYGAIRHAITVGFISLMMMGIAAKVVVNLNGIDVKRVTKLWGPFILINLGCFLRVSLQTLTDWNPKAYNFVGISGALEAIALTWWGIGLMKIMLGWKPAEVRHPHQALV